MSLRPSLLTTLRPLSRNSITPGSAFVRCAPHPVLFRPLARNHRTQPRDRPAQLRSGVNFTAVGISIVIAVAGLFVWEAVKPSSSEPTQPSPPIPDATRDANMPIARPYSSEILPGRPGNMTLEQEQKLRELWFELGKLTGTLPDRAVIEASGWARYGGAGGDDASSIMSSGKKKRRFGLGRKKDDGDPELDSIADKHGANKEFREAITNMTQQELRDALWDFAKCDDPDANLCRYLRARKWNVHKALVMLVSTIYWRNRIMKLDQDVMMFGDEAAQRAIKGETTNVGSITPKLGHDMIEQIKMGKSYIHGVDKQGRPMCYVKVSLHKIGEYSSESLERLTVYMIETARFLLKPPHLETAVLVFDMTGFSMANMDYQPLKFIIKVFEANYPESLGAVMVHNAPWIFSGIWNVIKGWLDPVVASKISFTKTVADISKLVDEVNIPKGLGGLEDWEYVYPPPVPGENDKMADHATRDKFSVERQGLLSQYEKATMEWVMCNGINDAEVSSRRARITRSLGDNYWKLDPYVRARTMYDRLGLIGPHGEFTPYPELTGTQVNGTGASKPNGMPNGVAYGATKEPEVDKRFLSQWKRQPDAVSIRSVDSVYYDAED